MRTDSVEVRTIDMITKSNRALRKELTVCFVLQLSVVFSPWNNIPDDSGDLVAVAHTSETFQLRVLSRIDIKSACAKTESCPSITITVMKINRSYVDIAITVHIPAGVRGGLNAGPGSAAARAFIAY
ncbi:hypothetical protein EVAR_57055_1 [Eumeta japonica]|uniref:Uncharacterized protein n=1 Tax=Eumeta variegata TaxID=151549 RepID=A0A4C1YR88_EUMVA|nr:hypothetical protein EVAR_57055_1 [Eumeta japonica]